MMHITTTAMHTELDARNAENIGEGRFVIAAESHHIIYIPSHRELVLEQIAVYAEQEKEFQRLGHELFTEGTKFSLIHDVETGEDYFIPELPGAELDEYQQRRFGPCASLVELFDAIIDIDMQEGE